MITNVGNRLAEEIEDTNTCKALPKELWLRANDLLIIMHSTSTIDDLKIKGHPPRL